MTTSNIDIHHMSEQERLQLLVDAIHDYAIYMLDPDGRVVTWNPGAERFKGYAPEEALGQSFARFFTAEDRAVDVPGNALRIAAREGRFETEGWRVRKDGTRFWAHVVLDAIRSADGALLGFAKITRDITDTKEAEKALFASEQRFRLLVQGVHDYAIYMLDEDGRVSNWNPGAQRIKGYSEAEIIGQHFSRFYTETDRAQGEPERALATALSVGKYEREAWRVRKDGSLFWAHVLIDPIYDDAGKHIGFAKITRDATDKKRHEEELEKAREAMLQSQKLQALGELAGGIAHDFNNLMTVITGSADFLRRHREMPEEKKLRYLDGIIETADRATQLTGQLLTFGRRQPVRPRVLDVRQHLESACELLGRTVGSTTKISAQVAEANLKVEVDPAQFESAVLNAVVNAKDAMPNGGHITLAARRMEAAGRSMVCVEIIDTGLGMPARVKERAFDPFFTTKEVGRGTGLGLSQIHGFAAQAGGSVSIQSEEGKGTTISILIPASEKSIDQTETKNTTETSISARILLVEDNEKVREFTEGLLANVGSEVISAGTADEALQRLKEGSFDLMLTDVVMPGMSGVELANHVRRTQPRLPIVLITGYSDELVSGGVDYPLVVKPFTSAQLTSVIASAIRGNPQL